MASTICEGERLSEIRALEIEHSAARAALRQEIVKLHSMIETRDAAIKRLEAKIRQLEPQIAS